MKNEENKLEEIYDEPSVFAVPCDIPFVLDYDKAKEFLEVKPNLELIEKRKELLKKLNIKVEIEPLKIEGPILKKIIK